MPQSINTNIMSLNAQRNVNRTQNELAMSIQRLSSGLRINSDRAILGAKLNRFESTVRNLENVRENITAARGRIQDADFAEGTGKLTRAQILQQARLSMVAQANVLPQSVLSLLQ